MPAQANNSKTRQKNIWYSWLRSALTYGLIFTVIYSAINWWRKPIMPANPSLQLTDHRGEMVDIDAMSQSAPVLVYFWGSWCGVCQVTSPKVNDLALNSAYPVVTIAISSGDNQQIDSYVKEHNFEFTVINDESGKLFDAWQGQVTPSYVIIEDGEMTQGLTGVQPTWSLRLRLWLAALF